MAIADHQKPIDSGFGFASTAEQVMAGHDLGGKKALITGGYSGLGLEVSRVFAAAGATLYLPARRTDAARKALADIGLADSDKVKTLSMDLGDFAAIRRAVDDLAGAGPFDFIINNAGIMACPLTRLAGGIESQFGTNHLGHFVLTTGLVERLTEGARVVTLSSAGHLLSDVLWDDPNFHTTDYNKWTAYGQSKTANSLFSLGLAKLYGDRGIKAFSVHPGGIMTPLQRHLSIEEMVGLGWVEPDGTPVAKVDFKNVEQGAATTVFAAVSEALEGLNGVYLEDCNVSKLATADSPRHKDVRPWAVSDVGAEKLWALSEKLLAEL